MKIEISSTILVIFFVLALYSNEHKITPTKYFKKYYQSHKYANLIDKYFDKNRYQGLTYFNPYQYVNSLLLEKSHILT